MEFMYCNKLRVNKQKHIILNVRKVSSVNFKNYDFTESVLKENTTSPTGFFEILQELIKKISTGEIQGIYNKNNINLILILHGIAFKKEYEKFKIEDSVILPLEIIKKEWERLDILKHNSDKVYVFKNKYDNFFIDFQGNPSFDSRLTMIHNTSHTDIAMKFSYLEVLAMADVFKTIKSEYYCINISESTNIHYAAA